ncbi:MAG: 4Fe-4S dicluster domain-containing protein [Rubrivivax sp.]
MPGSRRLGTDGKPAPLRAQVAPGCLAQGGIECRLCGEHCDVGAIRFPPRLGGVAAPVIDPLRCTGCGDCLPVCPSAALTLS